ncbi:DUF4386 family protein [Paenibacillus mucilaginosus]|uniref:DUF4386 family protein n=1 Tax=Paenibacillus mucilaginosus TaxID=61624 RepID=UPI001EE686AE|nr:DUF4386 family protein [Paenibacillus mucilaginosus]
MFPYLRRYNETLALGHVLFRFLEAVVITVGIISVLSLPLDPKPRICSGSRSGSRLFLRLRRFAQSRT